MKSDASPMYYFVQPQRPSPIPTEEVFTKTCKRCSAEFTTKARVRKWCDVCQPIVAAEQQQQTNARMKARRLRLKNVPRP